MLAVVFEEGAAGVMVAVAWVLDRGDEGVGEEEEVGWVGHWRVVEGPSSVYFGLDGGGPVRVRCVEDWGVLGSCVGIGPLFL